MAAARATPTSAGSAEPTTTTAAAARAFHAEAAALRGPDDAVRTAGAAHHSVPAAARPTLVADPTAAHRCLAATSATAAASAGTAAGNASGSA
jgi:hypothetical protein